MDETESLLGAEANYPSQDMVDRRDHLALIVNVWIEPEAPQPYNMPSVPEHFWPSAMEFHDELSELITEAVREVTGLELFPRPTTVHYQIGPAAGGLGNATDVIVTLARGLNDIPAAFDVIANTWAISEIVRRTTAKMRDWVAQRGLNADPVFTPLVLTALCEDHVRRAYHPRAKLSADWYCTSQEFCGGYLSPAHPTGSVTYLVTVKAGTKTYCYSVDGLGRVNLHYVKERARITQLPLPDLLR